MKPDKCFYCDEPAKYFDIVTNNDKHMFSDVCLDHLSMGLSS